MSGVQEQTIERSIEVNAPIDRVWNLLTDPAEMPRWWKTLVAAEIDLRPGGEMTLTWGEHGVTSARVEAVEAPVRFGFTWASNAEGRPPSPGDQTLVEFRLEEFGEITKVTVYESGFETLEIPDGERMTSVEGNIKGWTEALNDLKDLID